MPKAGETCLNCGGTIRVAYMDDSTMADEVDRRVPHFVCSTCMTPRGASDEAED